MGLFGLFGKKEERKKPVEAKTVSALKFPNQGPLPVEVRVKGKKATCDGLFPHEVLVLSYAPFYWTSDNLFPGFWNYKYGIEDVQQILDSLLSRGYIVRGDLLHTLNKVTIPEIKETLQELGLRVTGKKEVLIQRLLDEGPKSVLEEKYQRRPFMLTEKGQRILEKYEYIPYLHKHPDFEGLDIWTLDEMMQKSSSRKYRDVLWGYLNRRCIHHMQHNDFGLYRNCKSTMRQFLLEEGRTQEAFKLLLEVVYYDLSGLPNGFRPEMLAYIGNSFFPYENSIARVTDGEIKEIFLFQEMNGMSEGQMSGFLLDSFSRYQLPFHLFEKKECVDIILSEIKGDKAKVNAIYEKAEKRFKKRYKTT